MGKFSSAYADSGIQIVDALNIESLPLESKTRLVVDLIHDGMGRAMRVPVIVVRGRREGPVFGLTAALHGNELNGIPVAHRLVDALDPAQLRGSVVVVPVVNIPGLLANEREYRESMDLNHVMPGRPDGNEAQVYAYRFIERVVRHFDYLVDMHTASFGRENTLYVRADLSDEMTARMAVLQRPSIILHNPPSDRTLRGTASARGIPAITVEIGNPHIFQHKHIRRALTGIRAVLAELKMVAKRPLALGAIPVICSESRWIYTDSGGLLEVHPELGEVVETNAPLAMQLDAFGDVVREYRAPVRGVIIGKSINPVAPTGARIAHLGTIATDEQFPHVSEMLHEGAEKGTLP